MDCNFNQIMTKKGFTIIELVVVMAIVAIVGTMLVMIFTSTLRGSNKAQVLSAIKQGGQAVLENMDKTFRSAENVVCPVVTPPLTTASSTQIVIYSSDDNQDTSDNTQGIYTRYRFIAPTSSANGLLQRDNPVKQIVQGTGVLETDQEFINRVCTFTDPMSPTVLTDITPQTGVSVSCVNSDCASKPIFTRSTQSGSRDSVWIQFALGSGVQAPAVIAGQIDPVIFQTTIELR